jgi:hypothetical protein
MLVAWEAEEDGSADEHDDERGDHRQTAQPRTGLAVPALAEDVIQRPHPQEHADLQAPRYADRPATQPVGAELPAEEGFPRLE